MDKILKPTNDLIFKMIFGDKRNLDILADFLKAVLDLDADEFSEIAIVDPQTRIERDGDKLSILDVKVHTKSGHIIDIEMQVSSTAQMRDRIVFYTAKMVTEQLGSSDPYELHKVISIIITDYVFIKDSEVKHNHYQLADLETGSIFTDLIQIDTLELPKLKEQIDDSPLNNWLQFFKANSEEELTMIAEKSPTINKAVTLLRKASQDDVIKREYELREKAVRDEITRQTFSFREGKAEGIYETVVNFLNLNVPIETIMQATGLPKEKILALKN